MKTLLKRVINILIKNGGTEKNIELKKYISEIIYSPEEIKIRFINSLPPDSSKLLSSMAGDRRPSADESGVLKNKKKNSPVFVSDEMVPAEASRKMDTENKDHLKFEKKEMVHP